MSKYRSTIMSNCAYIDLGRLKLFFSYNTLCAVTIDGLMYKSIHSTTTSRQQNANGFGTAKVVPHEELETMISNITKEA